MQSEKIDRLLDLTQISVDQSEREQFAADLNRILCFVEAIDAVDTHGVEPLSNPIEHNQRLRSDEPQSDVDPQTLLETAPKHKDGFYVVPKVISKS